MRQLTDSETQIAERVIEELVGLTIEEAKEIIKYVLVNLHKRAVIRSAQDE